MTNPAPKPPRNVLRAAVPAMRHELRRFQLGDRPRTLAKKAGAM